MTLSIDKENLYDIYFNKKMSKKKICEILNCSERAIDSRFKLWGWSFRKPGVDAVNYMKNNSPLNGEDENVVKMYYEKMMTCKEIGDTYNLCESVVARFLKNRGYILRNNVESQRCLLDRSMVYDMYVNKKLSCSTISAQLKCDEEKVRRNLIYYGIKRRSQWEGLEKYDLDYLDNTLQQKGLIRVTNIKSLKDIKNREQKIKIKCLLDGHVWECRVKNLLQGSGCPICRYKGERYTYESVLEIVGLGVERNYKLCLFKDEKGVSHNIYVDVLIRNGNNVVVIEYNGEQHYEMVTWSKNQKDCEEKFKYQQMRDDALRKYCLSENITLVEIDGRMYNDKETIKQLLYNSLRGII
jgi:hypothetical protein